MTDTPEAVRLADSMLECVDDSPWLTCNVAKMDVKAAPTPPHADQKGQ